MKNVDTKWTLIGTIVGILLSIAGTYLNADLKGAVCGSPSVTDVQK